MKNDDHTCLVAHIALKVLDTCHWYLDNAYSKHMSEEDKSIFKLLKECMGGNVTFGDGS